MEPHGIRTSQLSCHSPGQQRDALSRPVHRIGAGEIKTDPLGNEGKQYGASQPKTSSQANLIGCHGFLTDNSLHGTVRAHYENYKNDSFR